VSVEVGYRVSSWDAPLRVNPNRTAGRFNRAGSPPTQYISLHPLTPWAEYLRFHNLRAVEDKADLRLRVWGMRLDLTDAVEIDYADALSYDLEPSDLISDDHGACRSLADNLRGDSAAPKTIIVPSAALPGTRNVVIFGERVSIPYLWDPIDQGDLPTCVVAERSCPPEGIAPKVRFAGDSHAEFEAWAAGHRYTFRDLSE
jgi:RES domain-containing protein